MSTQQGSAGLRQLRKSSRHSCREAAAAALFRFRACRAAHAEKQPAAAAAVQSALELLGDDAFHPQLRTHKLKGNLAGSWACAAGYDLRIVFSFVQHGKAEAILLETVGTHEEVY